MAARNALRNIPNTLHTLDEILGILHPIERFLRLVYLDFKRKNGRFQFNNLKLFHVVMVIIYMDLSLQLITICQYVKEARLSEAQQVGAIAGIELLACTRGLSILLKAHDIARFSNELDQIFPRDLYWQRRLNLPKIAVDLKYRFRYLYIYSAVALMGFSTIPYAKYWLFDVDRSLPVADEYHQNPSWLPFGIKQSHRLYTYVYISEYTTTMIGFSFLITWDRSFTILVSLMNMHFEFLGNELCKLDARDSLDVSKVDAFYKHLKELMAYQQHLNRLGQDFNKIFKLSIFAADMVCVAAFCFHFYLLLNTDDYMAIVLFLLPALVLIWLTFDVCQHVTHLEHMTSNISRSLYNHNWYEGSPAYRAHICMWMRHTYAPLRFHGFKQFEVNMAHFQQMMTLTYQMLTFLQSHGTKDNN